MSSSSRMYGVRVCNVFHKPSFMGRVHAVGESGAERALSIAFQIPAFSSQLLLPSPDDKLPVCRDAPVIIRNLLLSSPSFYESLYGCHLLMNTLGYKLVYDAAKSLNCALLFCDLFFEVSNEGRALSEDNLINDGAITCCGYAARRFKPDAATCAELTTLYAINMSSSGLGADQVRGIMRDMLFSCNEPNQPTCDKLCDMLRMCKDDLGFSTDDILTQIVAPKASGPPRARTLASLAFAWLCKNFDGKTQRRDFAGKIAPLMSNASQPLEVYRFVMENFDVAAIRKYPSCWKDGARHQRRFADENEKKAALEGQKNRLVNFERDKELKGILKNPGKLFHGGVKHNVEGLEDVPFYVYPPLYNGDFELMTEMQTCVEGSPMCYSWRSCAKCALVWTKLKEDNIASINESKCSKLNVCNDAWRRFGHRMRVENGESVYVPVYAPQFARDHYVDVTIPSLLAILSEVPVSAKEGTLLDWDLYELFDNAHSVHMLGKWAMVSKYAEMFPGAESKKMLEDAKTEYISRLDLFLVGVKSRLVNNCLGRIQKESECEGNHAVDIPPKRVLNRNMQKVLCNVVLASLSRFSFSSCLRAMTNSHPGVEGQWKRMYSSIGMGAALSKLVCSSKSSNERLAVQQVSLAFAMLHRSSYPATKADFNKQRWGARVVQPLAVVAAKYNVGRDDDASTLGNQLTVIDGNAYNVMHAMIGMHVPGVPVIFVPSLVGTKLFRFRVNDEPHAVISRLKGTPHDRALQAKAAWVNILSKRNGFEKLPVSCIFRSICSLSVMFDIVDLAKVVMHDDLSNQKAPLWHKCMPAASSLAVLCSKLKANEDNEREGKMPCECSGRLQLGTRIVKDKDSNTFTRPYSLLCAAQSVKADSVEKMKLLVSDLMVSVTFDGYFAGVESPSSGLPTVALVVNSDIMLTSQRPTGAPLTVPKCAVNDPSCVSGLFKGVEYPLSDFMDPSTDMLYCAITFDTSKLKNYSFCLDLSLVLFREDCSVTTGKLWYCTWDNKCSLEVDGMQHGGDYWGYINSNSNQKAMEMIAINMKKLLEFGFRYGVIVGVDWSGAGWDKYPELAMHLIDVNQMGSGPWQRKALCSFGLGGGKKQLNPLQVGIAVDFKRRTYVVVDQNVAYCEDIYAQQAKDDIWNLLQSSVLFRKPGDVPGATLAKYAHHYADCLEQGLSGEVVKVSLTLPNTQAQCVAPSTLQCIEKSVRAAFQESHTNPDYEGGFSAVVFYAGSTLSRVSVCQMLEGMGPWACPRSLVLVNLLSAEFSSSKFEKGPLASGEIPLVRAVAGWNLGDTWGDIYNALVA